MAKQGSVREPPYSYRAYGLSIASEVALPELTPAETGRDLEIRFGTAAHLPPPPTQFGPGFSAVEGAMYYRYDRAGTYCVREGREITIDPAPDAREELLRLYLTGPVLAAALHQRGLLVLHASAVEVDGGAIGFLGAPRRGKSTTAAALHARGHLLLTDDVAPVEMSRPPLLRAGFPQLKLWPEAATLLGRDPALLPKLHPDLEKRAHRVAEGVGTDLLPVRILYVLGDEGEEAVGPLAPQVAVIELVRNSYFAERLAALGSTAFNFRQCSELAKRVIVRAVRRGRGHGSPTQLAELLERDWEHQLANRAHA